MSKIFIIFFIILFVSCSKNKNDKRLQLKNANIMHGKDVTDQDSIKTSVVGIYDSKIKAICTGTLIDKNLVLTAAHCIESKARDLKIVFSKNLDESLNTREQDVYLEEVYSAVATVIHKNWNPKNEMEQSDLSDIALISFKGEIPANYKVASFLSDPTLLKLGTIIYVAGFGVNSVELEEINPKKYKNFSQAIEYGEVFCTNNSPSNPGTCYEVSKNGDGVLRFANAPISSMTVTEFKLNEKKAGTCDGDSGGPAFVYLNNQYYLVGVTSRGSDLCDEIGVYTNALYYLSWIEEAKKSLSIK